MEYPNRRRTCFAGAGAMPAYNANRVERLDLFLHGPFSAVAQSLFWTEARIESISLNYVFVQPRGKTPFVRTRYGVSVRTILTRIPFSAPWVAAVARLVGWEYHISDDIDYFSSTNRPFRPRFCMSSTIPARFTTHGTLI
jgi:hypothetical protein